MMKRRKAQSAIEFMIIFGLFLTALTISFYYSWSRSADISTAYIEIESQKVIDMITSKLDTAFLQGDGFSINMTVPEYLGSLGYSLHSEGNTIWINVNNRTFSGNILANNFTGTLKKGRSLIRNVEGELMVS